MKTQKTILLGLIAVLVIGTSAFADSAEPVQPAEIVETTETAETAQAPSASPNGIVRFFKAIENGVVSGYNAIENSVVSGYLAIETAFVNTFLLPRGWSPDSIPTGNMTADDNAVSENPAENSMAISATIRERYSPIQRNDP